MRNRVLLIGGNFYPEPIGIGKYNGEMMDWLAQNDYECTVVTTFPYYPYWKVQQPYCKKSFWYKKEIKYIKPFYEKSINIYRCPQYIPDNPTGAKRMLLGLSFFITSFLVIIKLLFGKKHNYVISVVPSFETGLLAILYKYIRGGKFFYHIQDLQIDAARDLQMIKSSALISFLFTIEKFILKQADSISSVSTGMIEKIKTKCNKSIYFFPNWVDPCIIYPIAEKDALKEEFNFKPSDKIVLYSGAVGEKQGLENILLVAESFIHNPHVKFVICGAGPYLKKIEELIISLRLQNVVLLPTQPADKLNHFLNMADIHLVIQKATASDLVMPSKLTTILAIGGVAIVTAVPDSSLYNLIKLHNMGLVARPEDVASLSEVMTTAILNDNKAISQNAYDYSRQYFSIEKIIGKYSHHMNEVELPELSISESFSIQSAPQMAPVES
jgi:colanic acid biosynthesis glycosyl transferase WcaI